MGEQVAQAVQANLSGLSNIGDAWIHTDDQAVWFSAADGSGDVEPYRLSVNGELTSWTVNDFGSTQSPTSSPWTTTSWRSVFEVA